MVFAGRNKEYGAYELRKDSNGRLVKAFLLVVSAITFIFAIPTIINSYQKSKPDLNVDVNVLSNIKIDETPIPDVPSEPLTAEDFPENINKQKEEKSFDPEGAIRITEDGTATTVGNSAKEAVEADSSKEDASLFMKMEEKKVDDDSSIENTPDDMAKFNGDEAFVTFRNYIIKNLKYPEEAMRLEIQGTVYVQFIVEKDGHLSHINILKGVMPLIDNEVLRLVKESPIWTPATKKGKPVRVSYTFPIVFQLN